MKKKKIIYLLALFVFIIAIGYFFRYGISRTILENLDSSKLDNMLVDKQESIVYIGNEDCVYCKESLPNLTIASIMTGKKVYYVDAKSDDRVLKDFMHENKFDYIPQVLILKNGQIDQVDIVRKSVGDISASLRVKSSD